MKKLEVLETSALKAYSEADPAGKKLLINLYGPEVFSPKSIWDRLQSFEIACEMDGVKPNDILRFSNPKNAWEEAKNAQDMLDQLHKIAVGDWQENWDDPNQKKHYGVFRMGAAFGFHCTYCDWTHTSSYGGPRLYFFPTAELAAAFCRRFEHLFKIVLNKPKRK